MRTLLESCVGTSPLSLPGALILVISISGWASFSNIMLWDKCFRSSLNHGIFFFLFLYAVSYKSQSQARVKQAGPNVVGMQPLPYNIRKGELQIATFQSRSPRVKCAAALVSYLLFYFILFFNLLPLLCVGCFSLDAICWPYFILFYFIFQSLAIVMCWFFSLDGISWPYWKV